MKENLGGQMEVSYLSLRGFTGKKCRSSMCDQGYFLECLGKKEKKVSVLLGKTLWEFLLVEDGRNRNMGVEINRITEFGQGINTELQILGWTDNDK